MRVSLNWLKNFVDIPKNISPKRLAEILTVHMAEVDSVKNIGESLENIVVGKVLKIEKHPNADKLKVCQVDIGKEKLTIICGGSNVREGILVAVAKIGAKVRWHGQGEPVELKSVTIRGVESQGMICASTEIGLSEMFPSKEEKEILDISSVISAKLVLDQDRGAVIHGKSLAEVLGLDDAILEIDNKSITNRPDLWGHYGIAREIATLLNGKLAPYKSAAVKPGKDIKVEVNVQDKKLCPRYMAAAIRGIKVAPSPDWLQKKLLAIGLRPINNIVDVTNYVMFDLGQPMHAFDNSKLSTKGGSVSGGKTKNSKVVINVRPARQGEEFVTLDNEKKILDPSMLIIADAEKPIALAGIMGGLDSGISEQTTTIIFESANFDAASVRKTSTKLGLRTESSARFEKSLDPNLCELALKRAVELTLQLCPNATVASSIVDEKKFKLYQGPLNLSIEVFEQKIGIRIAPPVIIAILKRLGFQTRKKGKSFSIKIPSWRATGDISIPEDIIEEVARVYGYDNIPISTPKVDLRPAPVNLEKKIEEKIKDILAFDFGMIEIYNYAFTDEKPLRSFGIDYSNYIQVNNPLTSEQSLVRQALLPGLITKTKENLRFFDSFRLFEVSKVFYKDDGDFSREEKMVAGVLVESKEPFYLVKGVVENFGKRLGIKFEYRKCGKCLYGNGVVATAEVWSGGDRAGIVGKMRIGEKLSIGFFELKLESLIAHYNQERKFEPLPKFPDVPRDLSFLIKKNISWEQVEKLLHEFGGSYLKEIELFDVYAGKGVPDGFKSLAFHLVFRCNERTLTGGEIDEIIKKIIQAFETRLGAKLRI